jgi:hypothetical protein
MRQIWLKLNLVAAAACSAVAATAQPNVIKIGVNQPLTGVVAASGNFVTNGVGASFRTQLGLFRARKLFLGGGMHGMLIA